MDFGPAVGTGGYAIVRRAVHRATGEIVAVKIMSLGRPSASAQGGSSSDDDSNSGDEDGSSAEDSGSDSDASSLHDMSISYQEVDIFFKNKSKCSRLGSITDFLSIFNSFSW